MTATGLYGPAAQEKLDADAPPLREPEMSQDVQLVPTPQAIPGAQATAPARKASARDFEPPPEIMNQIAGGNRPIREQG